MSISRAQKIVDLLEEALKEIRDYREQSIGHWKKVLLEGADRNIGSALSDIKEGFSGYLEPKKEK